MKFIVWYFSLCTIEYAIDNQVPRLTSTACTKQIIIEFACKLD